MRPILVDTGQTVIQKQHEGDAHIFSEISACTNLISLVRVLLINIIIVAVYEK